jgi:regulator of sirC expression with transglutaminase-like and TPR domain
MTKMREEELEIREFQALISLIDEPDQSIYNEISKQIHSIGPKIIPFLECEWENSFDTLIRERIRSIIGGIQFNTVCEDFRDWVQGGCKDLLSGCIILARYQDPQLSEEKIHRDISRIRKDIWLEMNDHLTALEQINVFNHVFYDVHGFSGNTRQYHASANSFLNKVLETRKGNPLSIGILYMLIAQSLDIPIFGVNMPEHFVLVYTDTRIDADREWGNQEGLFYINAFSKGTLYSKQEVVQFIEHLGHEPNPLYFKPCSNEDIVRRMLNNLVTAFSREGEDERVGDIRILQALFTLQEPL